MSEYAEGFISGTTDRIKDIDVEIKYWKGRINDATGLGDIKMFIVKVDALEVERREHVGYVRGFKEAMRIIKEGK